MAALIKDRNTLAKHRGRSINVPVAASTQIFAGAMVSSNATGFAVPASDTAGEVVLGIAEEQVDNSAGADADLEIRVRKGTFELNTLGTVVNQADVGRTVFVSDDNNVEKTAGVVNNIPAGTLDSLDVESGLPWVTIFDETS
jgi:hypothetical protein